MPNGNIYVIGGLQRSEQNNENQVLRDCFKIDVNMEVTQQEKMDTARFGSPLAVVHERFIFALGGFSKNSEMTIDCEAYDIMSNVWFKTQSLPFPIANTTACVMNKRKVYLMPGKQTNKA